MLIRSTERKRAEASAPTTTPAQQAGVAMGNGAQIDAMNRGAATPGPAPARVAAPPRKLTDAEQVAQSVTTATEATESATGQRTALDTRLKEMTTKTAKFVEKRPPLFEKMREELGSALPTSIASKDEIVERMGLPDGSTAGVDSKVLRAPADPDRPQLLAYAGENGQDALTEKLDAFKKARMKGEAARAFTGLFNGNLGLDRERVPAMSVLFDGSGLDAGIEEANGQIGGDNAKDLMAGMASIEAIKAIGSYRALAKMFVPGRQSLATVGIKSTFNSLLPKAKERVASEGAESAEQVSEYVVSEARAQMLTQKAKVEGEMVKSRVPLDKVGIGALFDQADTHLEPDSLNLFLKTKEGQKFWLEDLGGKSTFAEADGLEAATSPLHAKGQLDNAALSRVAMKQGLYPTAEGGFFRIPSDLEKQDKQAYAKKLESAYAESKGQPLPASTLNGLQ